MDTKWGGGTDKDVHGNAHGDDHDDGEELNCVDIVETNR
jgi:hypothetical protein